MWKRFQSGVKIAQTRRFPAADIGSEHSPFHYVALDYICFTVIFQRWGENMNQTLYMNPIWTEHKFVIWSCRWGFARVIQVYASQKLFPSGHTTFIQRRLNVGATSWRCIDVETTLYRRHVLAGFYWPFQGSSSVAVLCASVVLYVTFVFVLICSSSPSFSASRGLCVVVVTFPGYLYLHLCGQVNPLGSCRLQSANILTLFLGKLSPLSG